MFSSFEICHNLLKLNKNKCITWIHFIQFILIKDNHHSHGSHSPIPTSPVAQRRITNTSSNIDIKSFGNDHGNSFVLSLNDNRPRSSCGLPRLPGIKYAKTECTLCHKFNTNGCLFNIVFIHRPMITQFKYQSQIIPDRYQIWHLSIFRLLCIRRLIKSTIIQVVHTVRYVWIFLIFFSRQTSLELCVYNQIE